MHVYFGASGGGGGETAYHDITSLLNIYSSEELINLGFSNSLEFDRVKKESRQHI